ncbi:DUF4424 domain-containing protein [Enterobacter quasihormaechei]|uniref:DUF4424 domain-containing protein n=2 Tax=Enterobacter quasihormaechei TaxID=2529382 RepID=A0AAE8QYI0_9ENTR|nr:DUF4424 domain-containing protein [Enterobacter quasihormaechei]
MRELTGALLLITSMSVYANDTSIGDINSTIEFLKQNDISMEKERLLISPERINVDYLFVNHAPQDVTLPVAFPMPPEQYYESDRNPGLMNFKLSVNGKPVTPQEKWVALLINEKEKSWDDITDKLLKTGWTVEQLRNVIKNNAIFQQPDNLPALPEAWVKNGGDLLAVQQFFIWQQTFPAGKEVMINHTYTPSLTSGVPREVADITDKNCLTDENKQQLSQLRSNVKRNHQEEVFPGFNWAQLDYILTTGANWKEGVIGDFTLRIHKRAADEVAVVCFNHSLKLIEPLSLEFKQKNFKPEQDLRIIYLSSW